MADKLDLDYENDFEVSDSDEEYTQRERNLLKKVRKGKKGESSDEEVLRFESDSEPEKFQADSDLDDQQDDGLPDTRTWGKKKSTFYNTDFHDNDYNTYTEKEEEIATLEQQEALEIQKRLASELNETDFNIDMFALPVEQQEEVQINTTQKDFSDLSKKQKLALFKSEAPEFEGLVKDFSNRMTEYKDLLHPTIELFESIGFTGSHPFIDFVKCRSELILNYSSNISFYLMLKAKRIKVKNHPIVKRLVQFSQMLLKIDDIFEYVVKPQIEKLLAEMNTSDPQKSSKLKILENLKMSVNEEEPEEVAPKSVNKPLFKKTQNDSDSDDAKEPEDQDAEMELDEKGIKRKITRQIAKNKGLTASKRRELRNPRVKNKLKFNKAVKRRKGAVQPIRSKAPLYSGEATGIKTHVKRSVKIK